MPENHPSQLDLPIAGTQSPMEHGPQSASIPPLTPRQHIDQLVASGIARRGGDPGSQWHQEMNAQMDAFSASGDPSALRIGEGYEASDYLPSNHTPSPGERTVSPGNAQEIGENAVKHAYSGGEKSELETQPDDQLKLPDDAEPIYTDEVTTVMAFTRSLPHGQARIIVARPKNGVLRKNTHTGKPLNPRLISLGINGGPKSLWTTIAQSQGGKPWRSSRRNQTPQPVDGQQMIAIQYTGKLKGAIKNRVPLGERDDITVPEFDMSEAQGELAVLDELNVNRVDALDESRGAIVSITALELARQQGKLDRFGHVLQISPAGQGREGYLRSHGGAAAIAVQGLFRVLLNRERIDPLARRLKGSGNIPGGRLRGDPLGWRREQVSVAVSAEAELDRVTAELSTIMNDLDNPEQSLVQGFSRWDPAIREKNAAKAQQALVGQYGDRVSSVPHKVTGFREHAIPYGRGEPIERIKEHYQEMQTGSQGRR